MHCPQAFIVRVPQPDFLDLHFPPVWAPEAVGMTGIQPLAKAGNYFYAFVQKEFVIHIKNPLTVYLEKRFDDVLPVCLPVSSEHPKAIE
jgi:hypothetical protein